MDSQIGRSRYVTHEERVCLGHQQCVSLTALALGLPYEKVLILLLKGSFGLEL